MPLFSLSAKNSMLNSFTVATLSLHTAYDPGGANEVVGGTPAYVRLPVTFSAASAGQKSLTGAPYTFDIPATTVAWIGMYDAFGGFLGMTPNGGAALNPFVVDDLVVDTLKAAHHGFVVTSTLVVWAGSAGFLPVGLAEGTIYYVVATTPNTLQVSATPGGLAIALATIGGGFVQGIIPVTSATQSTFPVTALLLDATVAA